MILEGQRGVIHRLNYSVGQSLERDITPFLALTLFRPIEHDVLWQAGRISCGEQIVLWPTGASLWTDFLYHRAEFLELTESLAPNGPLSPLEGMRWWLSNGVRW